MSITIPDEATLIKWIVWADQVFLEQLRRPAALHLDPAGLASMLHILGNGGTTDDMVAAVRSSPEWHAIHDGQTRLSVALPRLVPTGHVFRLGTGERWTAIECSDFNLFARYLVEGAAAIQPVLAERQTVGFNVLRVWAAFGPGSPTFEAEIGRLVPAEHPELYDALPEFLALCASFGLYVELTAFTGGPIPGHWERLARVLPGITNVIVELTNENDAHADRLDTNAFQPLSAVVCSRGSNGSQAIPPRPPWQYETFHTNDASEWWRKGRHNGMELSQGDAEGNIKPSGVPVIANENTRPDRDGNIAHHQDAAAGCALLIAGSCFHSASGKRSALFSATDRPFAEAFVRGARSVNLEFQEGRYSHDGSQEGPSDLRVYQKILADGRRETVRIRK